MNTFLLVEPMPNITLNKCVKDVIVSGARVAFLMEEIVKPDGTVLPINTPMMQTEGFHKYWEEIQ